MIFRSKGKDDIVQAIAINAFNGPIFLREISIPTIGPENVLLCTFSYFI